MVALRMDAGRKGADAAAGRFGPYQSPMEDGVQHFHEMVPPVKWAPTRPPDDLRGMRPSTVSIY
jgi:hypothetical protein